MSYTSHSPIGDRPPPAAMNSGASLVLPLTDLYSFPPQSLPTTTALEPVSRTAHLLMNTNAATSASADVQRSLLQQQLQHSLREVDKLKEALHDTSARLNRTMTALNEQKLECSVLTHRYSTSMEKLTRTESDIQRLEERLVQECNRFGQAKDERDQLQLKLHDTVWEAERLQRRLDELEANRGLDEREVQRILDNRREYIPTVEVRRMQSEMHDTQQSLVDRLTTAVDALVGAQEEGETNFFVARSAVLSAAADLKARILRAEATLDHLHEQVVHYSAGLEGETNDFLVALMTENKELWQHLTKLQSELDLVTADLNLKQRRGDVSVRADLEYVQRQLEFTTDRLGKAQQVIAAQTALSREHETEMQALLQDNDAMQEKLERLSQELSAEREAGSAKTKALGEADAALRDATSQIQALQERLTSERNATDETIRTLNENNTNMLHECDQHIRQLQIERTNAQEEARQMARDVQEASARLAEAERELQSRDQDLQTLKQRSEEDAARSAQAQAAEVAEIRRVFEEEIDGLRLQLDETRNEARSALCHLEDTSATRRSLEASHRALVAEADRLRSEHADAQRQLAGVSERLSQATLELEQTKANAGDRGVQMKELERQVQFLCKEKECALEELRKERERQQQRCQQVTNDWRASEKARIVLQDELKVLRMRCFELETQRQAQERGGQEREQLMAENVRLQEQYQMVWTENGLLQEQLRALREHGKVGTQMHKQLEDLQLRLRELPQLQQAADEARREALKAREETEALRQERDEMASKLGFFLEESRKAAQMDEAFSHVVRDASDVAKRLGGQVSAAKERASSDYRVFSNTHPTGQTSGCGTPAGRRAKPVDASNTTPRHGVAVAGTSPQRPPGGSFDKSLSSPRQGRSAAASSPSELQLRLSSSAGVDAATLTGNGVSCDSTPQRPWR